MVDTTFAAATPVTPTRTSTVLADTGSADGPAAVAALLGLANSTDINVAATARILARITAGAGKAEEATITQLLDLVGSTRGAILYRGASGWAILAPGTNGQALLTSGAGADPAWGSVGGTADDWDIVDNSVSSSTAVTLANSSGNAVSIIAMTGNCTVSKPATLTGSAGVQYGRLCVFVGHASNDYTVTFGTGISLGVGTAPYLTVPANKTVMVMLYTRNQGTAWSYDGNPDPAAFDTATIAIGSDKFWFFDASDSNKLKVATLPARYRSINFVIDGGGSAITTGIKGDVQVDFAGTIIDWTILCDQSGSIVIDVWKDTYANYPPVVGDSITASAKPTVSAATKATSSTLTGWTTAVAAGDTLRFNVDSITTCTRVTLKLKVQEA